MSALASGPPTVAIPTATSSSCSRSQPSSTAWPCRRSRSAHPMTQNACAWLPPVPMSKSVDPPLRGELRYGLEFARLVCDPIFVHPRRQADAPPVLLVPGLMTGDTSLAVLRGWLRRRGSRTSSAGVRLNIDCAERAVGRLEGPPRQLAP